MKIERGKQPERIRLPMRKIFLFLLGLLCCSSPRVVMVAGSSSSSSEKRKGDLYVSETCRFYTRAPLQISSVQLLCTSGDPQQDGGDYQGQQTTYVNSTSCRAGDYAHLSSSFSISRKWNHDVNVNITIEASVSGYTATILDQIDLCSLDDDDDDDDNNNLEYLNQDSSYAYNDAYYKIPACPLKKGDYELSIDFVVPRFFQDRKQSFVPDFFIEFTDSSEDYHMVGCSHTGSLAMVSNSQARGARGARLFIFSILLFLITFAFCIVGHRRKRFGVSKEESRRTTAARMRRYHYRRSHAPPVLEEPEGVVA